MREATEANNFSKIQQAKSIVEMREWREQNTFLFFFNFFSFVDLNLKEENYNEPTKMHTKTYSELYETRSKVDVFQSMAFYRFFFVFLGFVVVLFHFVCLLIYSSLIQNYIFFLTNRVCASYFCCSSCKQYTLIGDCWCD